METSFDYIIIGGGMTAAAAAQALREVDSSGSIGVISAETQPPYNRPPLSKKLWQGKSEDTIWRDLPSENVEFIPGSQISHIETGSKEVRDQAGRVYGYQKLLLATGGRPRRLPFAPPQTVYYRDLEDYHTVRGWVGKGARIGIIGGGFIGSEMAAALAALGEQVVMVFPENGIGARIYPPDLSQFITEYYRQKGVEVQSGLEIQAIQTQGNQFVLQAKDGRTEKVDHIIAGIGLQPNIELAQAAGIKLGEPQQGGGILVDEYLRTNLPDIYAAGDAASFYNPTQQRWMRVEHEDNANYMGRTAGLNMAGTETPYNHQPFFYSDLFDLGFEAVGDLDPQLEIYADWKVPFKQGVVYYMKDRSLRGVLLWNTWDQVDAARELLQQARTYTDIQLQGLLPK